MTAAAANSRVRVLGVPIDALTIEAVAARAARAVRERGRLLIGVVNAAKLVNMRREPRLREAVLASDVILADGMPVVWAARLLGRPLPGRVAGIDLMLRLLEQADRSGYRVYCLGASEPVLGRVLELIRQLYPRLRLVGGRNGYFAAGQEQCVARQIAAARPDVLFVAMSSPRKELFLARWSAKLGVPVCHGVGGAFDVLAGRIRRAPPAWQRLGLEWLYRLWQEPRRLWRRYLVTNTLFLCLLAREALNPLRPRRA